MEIKTREQYREAIEKFNQQHLPPYVQDNRSLDTFIYTWGDQATVLLYMDDQPRCVVTWGSTMRGVVEAMNALSFYQEAVNFAARLEFFAHQLPNYKKLPN